MFLNQIRAYIGLFLVTLILICAPLKSYGLSISDIPNPRATTGGWVTDQAEVLSPETEQTLNQNISAFEAETQQEIAIVTVAQLEANTTPRAFGVRLFNHWGIGKAVQNNGVLVFLSMGDRRVDIITGRGIESILTDAKAQDIVNAKMLPPLSRDRPNEAVLAGTDAIIQVLKQKQPSFLESLNWPMALVGPFMISGVSLLFSALCFFKVTQRTHRKPTRKPLPYSEELSTGEAQTSQLAAWRDELDIIRLKSVSFFFGVYGVLSIIFVLVAYAAPRWLAVAFGLSFPIVFACKNLPRLWRSPQSFLGQFVFSFLFSLIFYGSWFALLGTGFVFEAESPIAPINAIFLAMIASAFTTINWRNFESSSGGSSRSHPAGTYGSSSGGSSGSSGGGSGGSFGGGSSDGGGAGGDW